MPSIQDLLHGSNPIWVAERLLQLGLGAALAGLVGWEREIHGRPAGIRTHMLIAIGVILFTQVSMSFQNDAARIAAQVVTGIGFLGAGSILRMGAEIKGLTSAASIWSVAASSMAIALGGAMMAVAIAATVLTLITLTYVDRLERLYLIRQKSAKAVVQLDKPSTMGTLVSALEERACRVESILIVERDPVFRVEIVFATRDEHALATVAETEGVRSFAWVD